MTKRVRAMRKGTGKTNMTENLPQSCIKGLFKREQRLGKKSLKMLYPSQVSPNTNVKSISQIVTFRSIPIMYGKEKFGIKPNTLRVLDKKDSRFKALRNGCKFIRIVNTKTGEHFTREITDYTVWQGLAIISWIHREEQVSPNTRRRKHPLLKNEIEIIQKTLSGKCYPSDEYILKVVERLEDLKRTWYKSR